MTTVELTKPIQAHGEERKTIELREPTGADIAACGFPFSFTLAQGDEGQTMTPNAAAIGGLISRLGDIPRSSVNQLSFPDWMECMGAIFSFFGGSAPSMSNGALTLPGSGSGRPARPSPSPPTS
jgi:hypothetical protein